MKIIAALRRLQPNRVAVLLTAFAGLLTALAPAVANLDTTSTVGLISGFVGIVGVVSKFLDGWQKYEAEERLDARIAVDRADRFGGTPPGFPRP